MPRGGKREGAGRPKGSPNKEPKKENRAIAKNVLLPANDWKMLADLGSEQDPPITATKLAQKIIKDFLAE